MTHRRTYMMCPSICNPTDLILGELNLVCEVGRTTKQVPTNQESWFYIMVCGPIAWVTFGDPMSVSSEISDATPNDWVWKAILALNMFFLVQSVILKGFCSSHLHSMDWFASESQRETQNQTCSKLRHFSPTKYG